jgi:multidrug resistance protein, MATE family
LVVSMSSWTVMNFMDRMFLLWHSEESVAAVLPAGMVHFAMICFPLGIASYVNTFVAQYHGAGHPKRVGSAVWQGARLGLFCIPIFLATIPLAPWIFRLAGHGPALVAEETIFFQTCCLGAGAEIIAASLAAFFTGLGINRVVMIVDTVAAIINGVLDYCLIFGHWGLPEMGIQGAALATVISLWFRVVAYGGLMMLPRYRVPFHLWDGRAFNWSLTRRLLRYGGPNGLQLLIDVAGFTLFLLVMGRLGENALAATNLAFNVNTLAFVPMLGLGVALSTIVGQQLGRNKPHLADRATWTGLWMAMLYMGGMALVYVLFPGVLLWGHAKGTSPAEFIPLRDTTIVLLRFVAVYCIFDSMNVVFSGALKGAGDTRFILITSMLMTPLPLATAYLGMRFFDGGLLWCWTVITVWISAMGFIYCGRFLQGHWRHFRVIEPELLASR